MVCAAALLLPGLASASITDGFEDLGGVASSVNGIHGGIDFGLAGVWELDVSNWGGLTHHSIYPAAGGGAQGLVSPFPRVNTF